MPAINTYALPSLRGWLDAKTKFESTKPIRGNRDQVPLGPRSKHHHMRIVHHSENNSYGCLLYGTEMLRYHPDETIDVRSYPTMSSNAFVSAVSPSGIWMSSNHRAHCLMIAPKSKDGSTDFYGPRRFYQFEGVHMRLVPQDPSTGWRYLPDMETIEPWTVHHVNKERARKALKKYRYREFRDYLITRLMLNDCLPRKEAPRDHEALDAMLDRSSWGWFLNSSIFPLHSRENTRNEADRYLKMIRERIYKKEDCLVSTKHEFLASWNQVKYTYSSPWS